MHINNVERLLLGRANAYLVITDRGGLLIDTGLKGHVARVEQALAGYGMQLRDLNLIFLTHTHYDHIGGAAALREKSGAPIMVHAEEAEQARRGSSHFPRGATPLGRAVAVLARKGGATQTGFDPVEPDLTFSDEQDLVPFGFPGKAYHTPGHSAGSACIVGEENGYGFVGDTLFGIWPRRVMPPFADRPELLPAAWRKLLEHGVRLFFPGHGSAFDRERLLRELWRSERKREVESPAG
jgi:glyoxylase-like metal-dependent hydrolase (beta-lactamase superfamily II)